MAPPPTLGKPRQPWRPDRGPDGHDAAQRPRSIADQERQHAGRGGAGDPRPGAGRGAARLSPLLGRRASLELGPGGGEPRGADRPDRRPHVAPQGGLGRGHAEPLQLPQGRGVLPDARDALPRAHRPRHRARAGQRPAHGPRAAARRRPRARPVPRADRRPRRLPRRLPAREPSLCARAGHARGPDGAGGVAPRLERSERAVRGALRPRLLVRPLHQRRRRGRGDARVSRALPAVGGLPRAAGERGRVRPVRGHRGRGAAPRPEPRSVHRAALHGPDGAIPVRRGSRGLSLQPPRAGDRAQCPGAVGGRHPGTGARAPERPRRRIRRGRARRRRHHP